jgi:hypothetical protein
MIPGIVLILALGVFIFALVWQHAKRGKLASELVRTIICFGESKYQWNWTWFGWSIIIRNSKGSVAMSGTFTNATMTLTGSGGGKGGHVTYTYDFSGTFTGSITQRGKTQSISGSIYTYATTDYANGAPGNVTSFSETGMRR